MLDAVRDESSKDAPVRLVFEPKSRTVEQAELITALLAHTSLESSVPLNLTMVGIDGRPVLKGLRRILVDRGQKRFSPGAWAALRFLDAKDPRVIRLLRIGLARWGFRGLNLASALTQRLGLYRRQEPRRQPRGNPRQSPWQRS